MANEPIKTIAGNWYSLTCTAPATVTAEIDGESVTLAKLDESGTTVICAPSATVTVETEGKYRLLPTKAPAAASVSNSSGGAIQEQIATALQAALFDEEPMTRRTPEGSANATCQYIELDAQHVPQGRLESVSLRSRSGNNPSTFSYLAVWELGEDGETWSYLGSSTNAPGQAANTTKVWEFAEGEVSLSGRKLRILAQAERSGVWETGPQLGVWTGSTPEGDESKCFRNGTGYAFLPELSIAVRQQVPKFAAKGDFEEHVADGEIHVSIPDRDYWNGNGISLSSHTSDGSIHVSASDRERWDQGNVTTEEKNYLARLVNNTAPPSSTGILVTDNDLLDLAVRKLVIQGTGGSAKLTVRGNETNVSVTGSQLSFNVPLLTVMSDVPVLYRYDMASGSSEVWLAGAPDAERLAPMGIAEAGMHVGAPSLPLCLRGRELRWNGTTLDVAALSELLARKDELLALLNTGQAQVDDSGEPG